MLTNLKLINFCQNLLGAPYWFNAPAIKATKNAYKINSIRFPDEYDKRDIGFYEKAIEENEIVTDSIGLIKGFAWSNGGEAILTSRGTQIPTNYTAGSNGCPDKSANGMFVWATSQDIKWGEIETLPELPGLAVTCHGRVGIYEGNGYVIEANSEAGYVTREPIEKSPWRYWYEIPFIQYSEQIIIKEAEIIEKEETKEIAISGIGYAVRDVLFREGRSEDSKLIGIIRAGEEVKIYNDSNDKLLHIYKDEEEGFAISDLFIYYIELPKIMSKELPKEFDKNLKGNYVIGSNVSLRNRPEKKSNSYVVLPQGIEVKATGGRSNNYLQIFVDYKNKTYVGYVEQKYLRRIIYVEEEN